MGLCLILHLCSPEQSNDDLVMEILSDILVQLPLTVENEEASGPESQSTFKFILSSSMWEKLQSNVEGEWRPWAPPAVASSAKTRTLEEGRGSPQMGGGTERKTGLQSEGRGSAKVPRPKVKEQLSQRTQHRALLGPLPTATPLLLSLPPASRWT